MKDFPSQRFLVAYSGALTIALGAILLSGSRSPKKAEFDEITTQRINIVEPDGTLRLVLSDKARFPGSPVKGKEISRPNRSAAGLLFVDDEGSEMGGLTYVGRKTDGKVTSGAHLTFDRYDGDQMLAISNGEADGETATSLRINDSFTGVVDAIEAGKKLDALPPEKREAAVKEYHKKFPLTERILMSRDTDKSALLHLNDAEGRNRIVLKVDPAGNPSIELLDASGKVLSRLPEPPR